MTVANWDKGTTYAPGDLVQHNGEVYQKANDADQSEPDLVAGGWELVPNTNVKEYSAIESAFSSYEQRKTQHRQDVADALQAAGLTVEDVQVALDAVAAHRSAG